MFFKEYLGKDLMDSFVFPPKQFNLNHYLPTKEHIRRFFDALDDLEDKALFLFFASSGLASAALRSKTLLKTGAR